MKVMTKSAIESLNEVISNARAHLALLWIMRNDLNNLLKALSQEKAHTGIKDHYVIHLTFYKTFFGSDHRSWDTELSEKMHRLMKHAWETTNKQYLKVFQQMLYQLKMRLHFENVAKSISDGSKLLLPLPLDSKTTEKWYYESSNYYGQSQTLMLENSQVVIKNLSKNKHNAAYNTLLVSFLDVVDIATNCDEESFKIKWDSFINMQCNLKLVKAVNCKDDMKKKSSDDYIIQCDGYYKANNKNTPARNICNFVEIKYIQDDGKEGTEMAHLVTIMSFTEDNTSTEVIYLMICWMKSKTNHNSIFPYPPYTYAIRPNRQLYFDIVPIESVIKPAFLISHSQHKEYYWNLIDKEKLPILKEKIFYCVPYERVVRNYCDSFVEFETVYNNNTLKSKPANHVDAIFDVSMMLSKSEIVIIDEFHQKTYQSYLQDLESEKKNAKQNKSSASNNDDLESSDSDNAANDSDQEEDEEN
jgi:hypothetical protein